MQNKTFRLFISSTFHDFKLERDAIQKNLIPKLQEVCRKDGFGFMAIDLRWGVNVDAQLDQRTMDLCLREVKACKSDPHPDFLILAGDRYGWIPLPYAIEKDEFIELEKYVSREDLELLRNWYKLDLNQLPKSCYILQKIEKGTEYAKWENWETVENKLREILQSAVKQTNLTKEKQSKYFTSATEAEFDDYTDGDFEKDSLFVVDRAIKPEDEESKLKSDFFKENDKEIEFKKKIKEYIVNINKIEAKTTLTKDEDGKDIVANTHIATMINNLEAKLTASIEKEIERLKTKESVSELAFQEEIKNDILYSSVKREDELQKIQEYIQNNTFIKPLLIYGTSGIGKSTIMASSIDKSVEIYQKDVRVLYRFIGRDKKLTSTKELFTSILKELAIEIPSFQKSKEQEQLQMPSIDSQKEDTFEYEVHDALQSIKEPIIIYIDALDQLGDKSRCYWLPQNSNIKIIISTLKDENYPEDSHYYEQLKERCETLEIKPLADDNLAQKILEVHLKPYNRTLQPQQLKYILELYKDVNSPLYLKMVAEEARFWSSDEKNLNLAKTQRDSIEKYMKNLVKLYHHEDLLVQKVFGYIYASRESLDEALLYEVLSSDDELMNAVKSEYHTDFTGKLPTAVWARLFHQIEPYTKTKEDGSIGFFHREFGDVAKGYYDENRARKLLDILQELIEKDEYKSEIFIDLHIHTLTLFHKVYEDVSKDEYTNFIIKNANKQEEWVSKYLNKLAKVGEVSMEFFRTNDALSSYKLLKYILKPIANDESSLISYAVVLSNLGKCYHDTKNMFQEAMNEELEAIRILEKLKEKSNNQNIKILISQTKSNLGLNYISSKVFTENVKEILTDSINILEALRESHQKIDESILANAYTNLGVWFKENNRPNEAIKNYSISIKILEKLEQENIQHNKTLLAGAIGNLADIYSNIPEKTDLAIKKYKEAIKIYEREKQDNNSFDENLLAGLHVNLGYLYSKEPRKCIEEYEKAINILENLLNNDKYIYWSGYATTYSNLGNSYLLDGQKQNAIKCFVKFTEIISKMNTNGEPIDGLLSMQYLQIISNYTQEMASYKNTQRQENLNFDSQNDKQEYSEVSNSDEENFNIHISLGNYQEISSATLPTLYTQTYDKPVEETPLFYGTYFEATQKSSSKQDTTINQPSDEKIEETKEPKTIFTKIKNFFTRNQK